MITGMVMLTAVKPQGVGKRASDGAHSKLQASVGVLLVFNTREQGNMVVTEEVANLPLIGYLATQP